MTADADPVRQLLDEAAAMPDGPAKLMILEEAVALADSRQETALAFHARQALIGTATFSGHPEKTLVAFSWCLALCDRRPDEFPEHELLWQYKWVLGALADFPQITRRQMEEMAEDMSRRYRRAGVGLRGVLRQRCKIAVAMGELKEAERLSRQIETMPRDAFSDCAACERDADAELLFLLGKDEQALDLAQPLLQGRLRCAEVPQHTFATVLLPLFRLGRVGEAMRYHQRGYRMIAGNSEYIEAAGKHLEFLVLTDNLDKAKRVFERHFPFAQETMCLNRRFELYLDGDMLLRRMQETRRTDIRLLGARNLPLAEKRGRYVVGETLDWIEGELAALARRFDERNGNRHFSNRIDEHRQLLKSVTHWPLRGAVE